MVQAVITTMRRRWRFFGAYRLRRYLLDIPEQWSEVPYQVRLRALRAHVTQNYPVPVALLHQYAGRWMPYLTEEQTGSIALMLDWSQPASNCEQIALPYYKHQGVTYLLPKASGSNVTCAEFAVCDDYYLRAAKGDEKALSLLTMVMYRPEDKDTTAADRRGDARIPFYSTEEAERRLAGMKAVPEVMQLQAITYFGGLKQWLHKVYGSYIFDMPDEDEEMEEDDTTTTAEPTGPNFGWWGILQSVAEGGAFGTLEQVYQANLHEVCIYLVRKKIETDRVQAAYEAAKPAKTPDYV